MVLEENEEERWPELHSRTNAALHRPLKSFFKASVLTTTTTAAAATVVETYDGGAVASSFLSLILSHKLLSLPHPASPTTAPRRSTTNLHHFLPTSAPPKRHCIHTIPPALLYHNHIMFPQPTHSPSPRPRTPHNLPRQKFHAPHLRSLGRGQSFGYCASARPGDGRSLRWELCVQHVPRDCTRRGDV